MSVDESVDCDRDFKTQSETSDSNVSETDAPVIRLEISRQQLIGICQFGFLILSMLFIDLVGLSILYSQFLGEISSGILMFIGAGIFFAQPACVVIWVIYGSDLIIKRLMVGAIATMMFSGLWIFGVMLESDSFDFIDDCRPIFLLPLAMVCASFPLMFHRMLRKRSLLRAGSQVTSAPGSTITEMLILTLFVAISVALGQYGLTVRQGTISGTGIALAAISGTTFAIGTTVLLPAVLVAGKTWVPIHLAILSPSFVVYLIFFIIGLTQGQGYSDPANLPVLIVIMTATFSGTVVLMYRSLYNLGWELKKY